MSTPTTQSVFKAFALLQAFDGPNECVTSAELSRRAGIPGASGYRLIQTLEQIGAIVRDERGRYRAQLRWSATATDQMFGRLLHRPASAALSGLASRLNATVHVGVLEDWMVTYVAKSFHPTSALIPTRVGSQLEAYCSATGKMLLAGMEAEEFDEYLATVEFTALTENTITDKRAFRREISQIRDEGYATEIEEAFSDICCIAAPIRNRSGGVIAAISASVRREEFTSERRAISEYLLSISSLELTKRLFPSAYPSTDVLDSTRAALRVRIRGHLHGNIATPAARSINQHELGHS